jgi:hypothetical protein
VAQSCVQRRQADTGYGKSLHALVAFLVSSAYLTFLTFLTFSNTDRPGCSHALPYELCGRSRPRPDDVGRADGRNKKEVPGRGDVMLEICQKHVRNMLEMRSTCVRHAFARCRPNGVSASFPACQFTRLVAG